MFTIARTSDCSQGAVLRNVEIDSSGKSKVFASREEAEKRATELAEADTKGRQYFVLGAVFRATPPTRKVVTERADEANTATWIPGRIRTLREVPIPGPESFHR